MVLPTPEVINTQKKKVRLAYLVSHPIQYQTPLLRRIAQEPDIELTVFFGSDFSVRGYQDVGFGVDVKWDVPLLDGYRHVFLPALKDDGTQTVTRPLNYGIWSALRGNSKDAGYDVLWLHGYAMINALQGMVAAKSLGIPVLIRGDMWLRDRPRSRLKLLLKRLAFQILRQFVSGVLTVGQLNDEYWQHHLGDGIPRFLMPYAVDNEYFQRCSHAARTTREHLLLELGLESGRPVILFASKLQERKHCGDLIEAYGILMSEISGAPPYLVIVGDGEERTALEEQVKAAGLKDVRFCGFRNQSELPRFFDLATVFVLPARHEPWGLIVNEAMNAGRAVILTDDVGCQPDLIRDGVEGFVYPVRDVTALAEVLKKVLTTPGMAERMGQSARNRIDTWSFEEDVAALRSAVGHVTRRLMIQD
jgi:glycosyltransferase involved in cell wall biosynthesis